MSWLILRLVLAAIFTFAAVAKLSSPASTRASMQPVGSQAPEFLVWDENDAAYTLADLLAPGRPVVLAFTDSDCPGCRAVKPLLDDAREAGVPIAVITRGDREPVPGALRQLDREVMAAYRAHVVPSAVLVGPDGRIATELARGPEAVAGLLGSAVRP